MTVCSFWSVMTYGSMRRTTDVIVQNGLLSIGYDPEARDTQIEPGFWFEWNPTEEWQQYSTWPYRFPLSSTCWVTVVPLWIVLVTLTVPTLWLWRIDRRRAVPGHCLECGYDLRGSIGSERCPECGTPTDSTGSGAK